MCVCLCALVIFSRREREREERMVFFSREPERWLSLSLSRSLESAPPLGTREKGFRSENDERAPRGRREPHHCVCACVYECVDVCVNVLVCRCGGSRLFSLPRGSCAIDTSSARPARFRETFPPVSLPDCLCR